MSDSEMRTLERAIARDPGDLTTARALYAARLRVAPDVCPKCYSGRANPTGLYPNLGSAEPRCRCCPECYWSAAGRRTNGGVPCVDCPLAPGDSARGSA